MVSNKCKIKVEVIKVSEHKVIVDSNYWENSRILKCFEPKEMSNLLSYSKSRWNGWNGNECVYKKDYYKAIEFYNTAIELYPLEYRYFVNRSFCFDQLQRFESALEDAQRALHLQSDWGKCYYRKARALKGLKRLEEAEICFLKVIELEGNHCKEAQNELRTLREARIAASAENPDINENISENKSDSKDEENNKNEKVTKSCLKNPPPKTNIKESEIIANEVENMVKTIDSESKNKRFILSECNGKKNLLKELSDFLLNRNILPQNESKIPQIDSSDKKYAKTEPKSVTENNKTEKKVENQIRSCDEFKSKKRNGRKGMDEIVEIWDDSRNHWSIVSNKSQNMISSKPQPFRKTE